MATIWQKKNQYFNVNFNSYCTAESIINLMPGNLINMFSLHSYTQNNGYMSQIPLGMRSGLETIFQVKIRSSLVKYSIFKHF